MSSEFNNKTDKNFYVFMGPPGAGKGTFSSLCVKKLGWMQFSMGNLCRQEIASGSEVGKEIDFIIKSGNLISDDLALKMLTAALKDSLMQKNNIMVKSTNIILDGFPRTLMQAEKLDLIMNTDELFLDSTFSLVRMVINDEIVIKRLVNRVICSNIECQEVYSLINRSLTPQKEMKCDLCASPLIRRKDDEESVIRDRLKNYYSQEQLLTNYYEQKGKKLLNLMVDKSLEDSFRDFQHLVKKE